MIVVAYKLHYVLVRENVFKVAEDGAAVMLSDLLAREQAVYEIGGVRLGGRPGELPTVLCGSMFYHKHRIVRDHRKGLFDREEAERLIKVQEEWSDRTGVPCMVDVVGETGEALSRYLDFVASVTDSPMLLNGTMAQARLEAARYASEVGLLDRVVYTSVNYTVTDAELMGLRELGVKCAIVQTFNPRDPRPQGALKLLLDEGGLLGAVKGAGVEKVLLMPTVLDVPGVGLAVDTLRLLKAELGLPSGIAPCGVVGYWRRTKELGRRFKWMGFASAMAAAQLAGADFIIYGSIRKAPEAFPVCALVDVMIAYAARFYGVRPLTKRHPIYVFA